MRVSQSMFLLYLNSEKEQKKSVPSSNTGPVGGTTALPIGDINSSLEQARPSTNLQGELLFVYIPLNNNNNNNLKKITLRCLTKQQT